MTEKNSSLFDNEIKEEDIKSLISSEIKKPNMRSQWFYYQTIRDVVRGEYSGSSHLSKKIMKAIDEEPTQMRGYSPAKELAINSNFYNTYIDNKYNNKKVFGKPIGFITDK